MRAVLIVNPNATSFNPAVPETFGPLVADIMSVRVTYTQRGGHATEIARQACADGYDLIVVHGGDGTVHEVVNALFDAPAAVSSELHAPAQTTKLAILPGGSANVFARALGINPKPLAAARRLVDLLTEDSTRTIGLGWADGQYFTFSAGFGIDARVCAEVSRQRTTGIKATSTRYARIALAEFYRSRADDPSLTIELPEADSLTAVQFALITNCDVWTYFNNIPMRTNPGTRFEAGLGVLASRSLSVFRNLVVSGQLVLSSDGPSARSVVRADDVGWLRIKSDRPLEVQFDGEFVGFRTELDIASVPNALTVLAPAETLQKRKM